jgi:hypothetical protein
VDVGAVGGSDAYAAGDRTLDDVRTSAAALLLEFDFKRNVSSRMSSSTRKRIMTFKLSAIELEE